MVSFSSRPRVFVIIAQFNAVCLEFPVFYHFDFYACMLIAKVNATPKITSIAFNLTRRAVAFSLARKKSFPAGFSVPLWEQRLRLVWHESILFPSTIFSGANLRRMNRYGETPHAG